MPSPFHIIYSPEYRVDIGRHVFPTDKYHLIYDRILKEGLIGKDDIIFPDPAAREDLLLVHAGSYIDKLFTGTLDERDIMLLELPYSRDLVNSSRICVNGTIETYRCALRDGMGIHLGGGFHHAFADHGEGFCVFNDIAIGVRKMQQKKLIDRAMVVDCDLHQGNGTADIFKSDDSVFTFSIHQQDNYPAIKPPGDMDIGLRDNADDDTYLKALSDNLPGIVKDFKPDLLIYVAGADVYEDDQLGGLSLTMEGISRRDEYIFTVVKENRVPVAVLLAGGYATDINDTVTIHHNMIRKVKEMAG